MEIGILGMHDDDEEEVIVYDPNALIFIGVTGITDSVSKNAINNLVKDLKAINAVQANFVNFDNPASSKLRFFYPLVGGTADSQKWNLIDPRDLDAAFRIAWANDHAANHTVNGYKPNGIDQCGDTKCVPSVSLTEDDTHLAIYPTDDVAETIYDLGAVTASGNFGLASRGADNLTYNVQYDGSHGSLPPSFSSIGFFIGTRTDNSILTTFRDGGKTGYDNTADVKTRPDVSVWLGGMNYTTPLYASKNYGCASGGAGITDAAAVLYDAAVYKAMLALGRVSARPTVKLRAGVCVSVDDQVFNTAGVIKVTQMKSGWGFIGTIYQLGEPTAQQIIDGTSLIALGWEIGTHENIQTYRLTHTPAETWTNLIALSHNEVIAHLGVTPVSFANHIDGATVDVDLLAELETNHGYVNIRLIDQGAHDVYYDGSSQIYRGFYCDALAFADIKPYVDDALANDKILIMFFHYSTTRMNVMETVVAYVKYLNMSCYTAHELIPALFA